MPNPKHAQEDAALGLALDQPDQLVLAGHADVEVAVGGQDDAVRALLDEVLDRGVIGELEPRAAVGRAAGLEALERREDLGLLVAGRGGEHQARRPRVDDDRHTVVLAELLDQPLQRRLITSGSLFGLRPSSPRRRSGRRGCSAAGGRSRSAGR